MSNCNYLILSKEDIKILSSYISFFIYFNISNGFNTETAINKTTYWIGFNIETGMRIQLSFIKKTLMKFEKKYETAFLTIYFCSGKYGYFSLKYLFTSILLSF